MRLTNKTLKIRGDFTLKSVPWTDFQIIILSYTWTFDDSVNDIRQFINLQWSVVYSINFTSSVLYE